MFPEPIGCFWELISISNVFHTVGMYLKIRKNAKSSKRLETILDSQLLKLHWDGGQILDSFKGSNK